MFYLHNDIDLIVGKDTFLASNSPTSSYAVVFEDDEQTAYLYAVDSSRQEQGILDALHVYNVLDVRDKNTSSKVQLCWHKNGLTALLFINDYPHVVYDFENKIGYSRNNFPEPAVGSEWKHEILTDKLIDKLAN